MDQVGLILALFQRVFSGFSAGMRRYSGLHKPHEHRGGLSAGSTAGGGQDPVAHATLRAKAMASTAQSLTEAPSVNWPNPGTYLREIRRAVRHR